MTPKFEPRGYPRINASGKTTNCDPNDAASDNNLSAFSETLKELGPKDFLQLDNIKNFNEYGAPKIENLYVGDEENETNRGSQGYHRRWWRLG